jgi:hypothetical protein
MDHCPDSFCFSTQKFSGEFVAIFVLGEVDIHAPEGWISA